LAALAQPNPNRDDQTLILGDLARKAIDQVRTTVAKLLLEHHTPEQAEQIARTLSEGHWTHDYPIDLEEAKSLGLLVRDELPREVYELMELYPQTRQQRPSVEFIPTPYRTPLSGPDNGRRT
jgi:ClpP class serine protease